MDKSKNTELAVVQSNEAVSVMNPLLNWVAQPQALLSFLMMVCGESEACCSVLIQTFHACGSCLCNARMGIKSRVIQSEPRIKPQKSPPNEISKPTPKTLKSAVMARISTGRPIMSECLSRTVVFLSFGFDGVINCHVFDLYLTLGAILSISRQR